MKLEAKLETSRAKVLESGALTNLVLAAAMVAVSGKPLLNSTFTLLASK